MRATALCLLLAGCTCVPTRVEIPIPVPCRVTPPAEPVWATESLSGAAGIWEQVRALLAERRQRIGYETQLRAAATACGDSSETVTGVRGAP